MFIYNDHPREKRPNKFVTRIELSLLLLFNKHCLYVQFYLLFTFKFYSQMRVRNQENLPIYTENKLIQKQLYNIRNIKINSAPNSERSGRCYCVLNI